MKTEKAAAQAGGVKVKITSEAGHRHAGTKYPKDATIIVAEGDAKLIVDHFKVGESVKGE